MILGMAWWMFLLVVFASAFAWSAGCWLWSKISNAIG